MKCSESESYSGADGYRYEGAVTDGNLITASGIAPIDLAREIFHRRGFHDPKTIGNWYLLYGKQDPAEVPGWTQAAHATMRRSCKENGSSCNHEKELQGERQLCHDASCL